MILHIANGFNDSKLYELLFYNLSKLGVNNKIYTPVSNKRNEHYVSFKLDSNDIFIRKILNITDRIFYRKKINKIKRDVIQNVKFDKVKLIHAHTLYSDGGVALKLKESFGIPFITAVRSTDVYVFNKYRPDLKYFRNKILKESSKIIFISPSLKKNFLKSLNKEVRKSVLQKSEIIPNGINSKFLANEVYFKNNIKSNIINILFVGSFIKRKNLPALIEAVKILNKSYAANLRIIGGGGDEKIIHSFINSTDYPFVDYLGKIKDEDELINIYAKSDIFAMVSNYETFGLVYIEALSQGTPIIYTRGDGVDGFFESDSVGKSVDNVSDPEEIAQKILQLSERLGNELSRNCIKVAKKFDWSIIATYYQKIYSNIINS